MSGKASYYPVFLDLRDRRCVVVGGGEVAERKIAQLLESSAHVQVISPEQTPTITQWAEQGTLEAIHRPYLKGDLEGAFLVIVATDNLEINKQVAREARDRHILVNVVDIPQEGNFIMPATVRRGDIVLAISTGGRSPALARKLRQELERFLSPEYAALLDMAAQARQTKHPSQAWQAALDEELLELVRQGKTEEARSRLEASLRAGSED